MIAKLAQELEASCDWSIRKMAKESIIKNCTKAKKKDPSIRFKTEGGEKQVHFIQYGNTYNVNEPNVECKHNKAYDAHLKHMIGVLEREAYTTARKTPSTPPKRQPTSERTTSTPRPAPQAPKKQLWSCRVPNYIRTYRIVDENEKSTLENTYNITCSAYN